MKTLPEPYRIKVVEPIRLPSLAERKAALAEAGYNTFLLRSRDVYIDFLTDSGTNAMSDMQWSKLMLGDEAYAGSRSFYELEAAIREVYGYKYVVPTHQGRGAEHILSRCLIKAGDVVPGNMYFTTTRLHQELAGGEFVDVICDEAHDPSFQAPFKGNVDVKKLEKVIAERGASKIAYVTVGAPVNMAGGQPVSMDNLRKVSELCRAKGVKVVLDAARAVENAYFIQRREAGYQSKSIKTIVREMCALTDACTMSAKKDAYANIGGFMACNDEGLYEEAQNLCVVFEGLHTYGGLAGRDLEALAQGVRESVERDENIAHRVEQVAYLWRCLDEQGVPMVRPAGGHAVFLDAKAFLPHVPQSQLTAQALCAALYEDSGVRTMERGIVSAGRDKDTGHDHAPKLELVRLALPRRVYTQTHLDYVAESVGKTYARRAEVPGLKFTFEPKRLRFFQARFAQVPVSREARPAARKPRTAASPA